VIWKVIFYSRLEHSVWEKNQEIQTAFPDPGDNFVDFKPCFIAHAEPKKLVDKSTFHVWHTIWKHNVVNQSEYHEGQNQTTDFRITIVGLD
jgi:hypothetical protein